MIIYGSLAQCSVGQLFAGGVIPGIILSLMFMVYIGIRAVKNPLLAPKEGTFSLKDALLSFFDFWPTLVIMFIVLGGIFGGLMTPTEAAAAGASASLVLSALLRKLTWRMIWDSLLTSLGTSCMIMFLLAAGFMFSSFLGAIQLPTALLILVQEAHLPRYVILSLVYLLYFFFGCFIDTTTSIIMTSSVVIPLITGLGFDVIWFGVVLVLLVEVGLLTPPFGLNLFVIQSISKKPLGWVVEGSYPFFIIILAALAIYTIFPQIILWLPQQLFSRPPM